MTAELKRLQLRFPTAAAEAAEAEGGDGGKKGTSGAAGDADELPPWVTSSEVMSPLLAAYDARIQVNKYMCVNIFTIVPVRIRMFLR